jgi:hypothetical protein
MRFLPLFLLVALSQAALAEDWLYLTSPGDTPIKIGHDYLKNPVDWPAILKLNRIANPRVLPTNTRIRIPVELLKVTPAPVLVTHITGNVRIKPEGGVFRPLVEGDKITGGETVLTGPNSFAGFRLADGSMLSEQASSKLSFGRLAAYGKTGMVSTELNLASGRLEAGASKQIGPAGGFHVVTPVAVAGLRGTAFRLNVSEDGKTLYNEVLQGVVGIAAEKQEVLVAKAQGTVAKLGQPPELPRPLLPAPSLNGVPDRTVDLPLAFSWPQIANAIGWRAQVAADADFRNILLDGSSDTPQIKWDTKLPDGHYFLRVRAIDAAGLEGLNTDHPFELNARPLPPELSQPAAGGRAYEESVKFAWSAAQGARHYILQIAPSADFAPATTISHTLDSVIQDTVELKPGTYFWRMASVDENGPHGWSTGRSFRVQPLPAAPAGVAKTNADSGQASFSWEGQEGVANYEFEIARKADFTEPEVKQSLTESRITVKIKPGRYVWRVRGVEADGQAGGWSKPNLLLMPMETPRNIHIAVSASNTDITWLGNAPSYRLEFSHDPEFRTPLFNHLQKGNATGLPRLEPGQYWLRIVALGEDGSRGSESKPVKFLIFGW